MQNNIYRKCLFHLSLLGVAASILVSFYDVIFGSLLEFFHLIFEVVEMGMDRVVEHFFDTDLHQTQLIVFYILLTIGGFLIYFAWKVLATMCSGLAKNIYADWSELVAAMARDWKAMSMINRVILVSVFLLVNYLASFLLF